MSSAQAPGGPASGGVGAFQTFFERVPKGSGIAWAVIQHMAPDRASSLREIRGRMTSLPVAEVAAV